MFAKILRTTAGQPHPATSSNSLPDSAQPALLSTREIELRRMYERMAQHQRLIEVEDDLRRRF
jgi:hypothetical protein